MQFSSSVVVHVEAVVVVVDDEDIVAAVVAFGDPVVVDVKSFGETGESGVPITV